MGTIVLIIALSFASYIVFSWLGIEVIKYFREKREKRRLKKRRIFENIIAYIEYFHDSPLETKIWLIESELSDPNLD